MSRKFENNGNETDTWLLLEEGDKTTDKITVLIVLVEPQEEANKEKTDQDIKEWSNMFKGNHALPTFAVKVLIHV